MIRDEFTPKPDLELGKYLHYRGDPYEVLDVACNSETLEWVVVYRPLYDHLGKPDLWVRPYSVFVEEVEKDGQKVPRFKKVGN